MRKLLGLLVCFSLLLVAALPGHMITGGTHGSPLAPAGDDAGGGH
jgi:hypothetical protein